MKQNVYDFDETIYGGDSTKDFYKYCYKRNPKIVILWPKLFVFFILYILGRINKTRLKEVFYEFLKFIENIENVVNDFWKVNKMKIKQWYIENSERDDIIISASPMFLLEVICKELNINNLIASNVDIHTGKTIGENCFGDEKVRRLKKEFPNSEIGRFYSDSLSDAPLAKLADKAYIVRESNIVLWEEYTPTIIKKIKNTFLSVEFFLFVFCGGMGTLSNFLVSLTISTRIEPTISYMLGYIFSLFISYGLNSILIFKEKLSISKYIKFILSYVPNFILLVSFVAIFINIFNWNKVVVYALAGVLGLPVTYILVKVFAFKR